MGFQVNGTTVLDSSGIQNNANSFRTLDGNNILGSGNITDSGPADALSYGNVGVYTWATIIVSSSVGAGSTSSANNLGCPYQNLNYNYRQGINEPAHSSYTANYSGYSGTWRNMLHDRTNGYQSLWVRIS